MRISVSTLDSFQYYLSNDVADEKFISDLTDYKDNRPMQIGRAYESILRYPAMYDKYVNYECDNIVFDNNSITNSLSFINRLQVPTWQIRGNLKIGDITLSGICDIMNGLEIIDLKTTANYSYEKYANSWQWRCYLEMFNLDYFKYIIAEIKDNVTEINVKNLHIVELYRYDNMLNDLTTFVNRFKEFIVLNKLEHLFKDKY